MILSQTRRKRSVPFPSTYGKAWSGFVQPIEIPNQDAAIFNGMAQSDYDEFGRVVLRNEESAALAKALGKKGKGTIQRNHSLLTVGGTVDEAAYLLLLIEKSCQVQLADNATAAMGRKKGLIDGEPARFTFGNTSEPVSST
ncbi:hypothetical protein FQN50_006597 [Emmonsiellopsis sp. PD_5]|nr:hypothetical protein FQN50_006597 [Emmonsiellopsis sp. PD_5]